MKLFVLIRVSVGITSECSDEKLIEVPCGQGQQSFKWLGMVASQRFSLASPLGGLRFRDDIRGLSDNDVALPTGILV